MLRGIMFVNCDYCGDFFKKVHIGAVSSSWSFEGAVLEEDALEDGWCHCLDESTDTYKLMCGACIHEMDRENQLFVSESAEIDF